MCSRLQTLGAVLALGAVLTACDSSAPNRKLPTQTAPPPVSAAPREIPRIQADAARCAVALFSGDIDGLLTLTHPKLIEASGGEQNARKLWEEANLRSTLTHLHAQVETSFPSEPVFVQGKEHEFVIIPLRVEVRREGMKPVEQRLFPIAIRRIGADRWGYTDGSSSESIREMFPDFPSNVEIPEATVKVLD